MPERVGEFVGLIISEIEFSGLSTIPVASGIANCSTTLASDSPGITIIPEDVGVIFSTIGVDEIFDVVQEMRRKEEERKIIKNFIIEYKIRNLIL